MDATTRREARDCRETNLITVASNSHSCVGTHEHFVGFVAEVGFKERSQEDGKVTLQSFLGGGEVEFLS